MKACAPISLKSAPVGLNITSVIISFKISQGSLNKVTVSLFTVSSQWWNDSVNNSTVCSVPLTPDS